jgi:THO complex subunit 5
MSMFPSSLHAPKSLSNNTTSSHSYQKLPLLPIEEFLTLQPRHAEASEHDQMLARIEHEHSERVALEETRQGLLKKKQTFIAENNKRKEILAGLDKSLEKWMEGAKGVEKDFEKAEQEMRKREEGWSGSGS